MRTDFSRPDLLNGEQVLPYAIFGVSIYRAPTGRQLAGYRTAYEEWLGKVETIFKRIHLVLQGQACLAKVTYYIQNVGSVPADQVQITHHLQKGICFIANMEKREAEMLKSQQIPDPPEPPRGSNDWIEGYLNQLTAKPDYASAVPDLFAGYASHDQHSFYPRVTECGQRLEHSCDHFKHQGNPLELLLPLNVRPGGRATILLSTDVYAANLRERQKGELVIKVTWVQGDTLERVRCLIPRPMATIRRGDKEAKIHQPKDDL